MIETVEISDVQKLPGNKFIGAVFERVEHAVLNIRMFCQGHQHPIFGDEKRIID